MTRLSTADGAIRTVVLGLILVLAGCDPYARQARGFSLPEGDVERGKFNFWSFRCNACHSIGDIPQDASEIDYGITVRLGGQVSSIKTYGDLVTSIINPSHRISKSYLNTELAVDGKSKMLNYNDVMTVAQLIDLVTYLQTEYELLPHAKTMYGPLYPVPL